MRPCILLLDQSLICRSCCSLHVAGQLLSLESVATTRGDDLAHGLLQQAETLTDCLKRLAILAELHLDHHGRDVRRRQRLIQWLPIDMLLNDLRLVPHLDHLERFFGYLVGSRRHLRRGDPGRTFLRLR